MTYHPTDQEVQEDLERIDPEDQEFMDQEDRVQDRLDELSRQIDLTRLLFAGAVLAHYDSKDHLDRHVRRVLRGAMHARERDYQNNRRRYRELANMPTEEGASSLAHLYHPEEV